MQSVSATYSFYFNNKSANVDILIFLETEAYPAIAGGIPSMSPLNWPQSCTSNDVFPPNTPNGNFLLDSAKNGQNNMNYHMFGMRKCLLDSLYSLTLRMSIIVV